MHIHLLHMHFHLLPSAWRRFPAGGSAQEDGCSRRVSYVGWPVVRTATAILLKHWYVKNNIRKCVRGTEKGWLFILP